MKISICHSKLFKITKVCFFYRGLEMFLELQVENKLRGLSPAKSSRGAKLGLIKGETIFLKDVSPAKTWNDTYYYPLRLPMSSDSLR